VSAHGDKHRAATAAPENIEPRRAYSLIGLIKRSLLLQIVLVIMALTTIVLSGAAWLQYRQLVANAESAIRRESEISADILTASLSIPMYNYDIAAAEAICRAMMDRSEVVLIVVEDHWEVELTLSRRADGSVDRGSVPDAMRPDIMQRRAIMHRGEQMGFVQIGVTMHYAGAALQHALFYNWLQLLALEILQVLPLVMFVRRRFILPVRDLEHFTNAIVKGDLNQPEPRPRPGTNEIGILASATLQMRNSINDKIQAMQLEVKERRQAEQRLRLFMDSVQNSSDAVSMATTDGRYYYRNNAFDELFGEIGDDQLTTLYVDSAVGREVLQAIMSGEHWAGEVQMYAKDHNIRDILLRSYANKDADGRISTLVNIHTDITEQKKLEARLRHSEKMDAIGQLAGGIAHDFNNQLGGIIGYAELLEQKLTEPTLRRYAESIVSTASRAADLTQKMLAFARTGKHTNNPVDLHQIIGEAVAILERSIDKRIQIRLRLDAANAVVIGDHTQLQNAILNLGLNARDAMPDGGELSISTAIDTLARAIPAEELTPGRYLVVSVTDTGVGINTEMQKRLFEPFFTTKEPGKGTGLGLSSVYGAVRSHGGVIHIYSEPGHGSTFRIHLPLATDDAQPATPWPAATVSGAAPGQGRILLVDDEKIILEIGSEFLQELGYELICCNDPLEAINVYEKNWRTIDLVILDLIMPQISGGDLFHAMQQINPAVRALLTSGYAVSGEAQRIIESGALAFVPKPFRQETLAHAVADALTKH